MARFNRRVLNRGMRRVAVRAPGLGVVVHEGRRTGREFRTPVNVFHSGDRWTLALTYGRDTDWVRNVTAAGGCTIITRGRSVRLTNPRIVHDESRSAIRPIERQALRLLNVSDFLVLDAIVSR